MEQNGDAADDAQQKTTGHGEYVIIRRDNSVVALYNSSMIFSAKEESQDMIGTNNFDLAEAFYLARSSHFTESDNYVRNAGAVQLFSKGGIEPLIIKTPEGDKRPFLARAMSQSIKEQQFAPQSSLGHSERILMRDVLDDFIIANEHDVELPPPSRRTRSADKREYDIEVFRNLVEDAREYRGYLVGRNTIVKMWSELKPCDYKPGTKDKKGKKIEGEGGKCSDFIDSIFPVNSQYGYIADTEVKKVRQVIKEKGINYQAAMAQIKKDTFGVFEEAYNGYIQREIPLMVTKLVDEVERACVYDEVVAELLAIDSSDESKSAGVQDDGVYEGLEAFGDMQITEGSEPLGNVVDMGT